MALQQAPLGNKRISNGITNLVPEFLFYKIIILEAGMGIRRQDSV